MGDGNGRLWTDRTEAADGPVPRVASDEPSGVFRVSDSRVFQAGGRAFCRSWLAASVRHPGVRKASIDLATATAQLEFEPGSASTATMAATFSEAVREALATSANSATDRSNWVTLIGFAGPDSTPWEVSRRSSDRLQLRPPALVANHLRRADWLDRVIESDGVTGCRSAWFSDHVTVAFDPALTNEDRIIDALRRAWLESAPATAGPSLSIDRSGRTLNLVKAGGSFAMTLVGIAVPGIPTLPFLLGTSYYLARSSPRLNAVLLDSPVFGTVLREWEEYHGLSLASKAKILGLSAAIMTVSLVIASLNPIALIPVLLISTASVYATLRIPGLPATEDDGYNEPLALTLALG